MQIFKKILLLIIVTIITVALISNAQVNVYANLNTNTRKPAKVGVLLSNFNDLYISNVRKNLEDIQKANPEKVKFTFFDAKGNQAIQNEIINSALENDFNLLLVNFVNINTAIAQALYTIGMNLINNVNPLENTNYKFDKTGVTVRIPHHEYVPQ